jgi:hypothetical protein
MIVVIPRGRLWCGEYDVAGPIQTASVLMVGQSSQLARRPEELMLVSLIIMITVKSLVCETYIHVQSLDYPFHLLLDPCRANIVCKEKFYAPRKPLCNQGQGRPLARSSSPQPHIVLINSGVPPIHCILVALSV